MDIVDLYYQGNLDVIMDNFNIDDVIKSEDIITIYFYMRCVSKFKRCDLLDVIFSYLKSKNTEDTNIIHWLGILDWAPDFFNDAKEKNLSQLNNLTPSNDDVKIILLRNASLQNSNLDQKSRLESFFEKCKSLGLNKSRIYIHIETYTDKNKGIVPLRNFAKKLQYLNLNFDKFNKTEIVMNYDTVKKHYSSNTLNFNEFVILMFNKQSINSKDFISSITTLSAERNKILPFDNELIIVSNAANIARYLGFTDIAKILFDRFKEICLPELFGCFGYYQYLVFMNDHKGVAEWLETFKLNKTRPFPSDIIDYMGALINSKEFKKYEEAYEKWYDIAMTSKSKIRICTYNWCRILYLVNTHQIQVVKELNNIIDDNKNRLCSRYILLYNNLRNEIITKTAFIKSLGFDFIENYDINDPSGCFDCSDQLICSLCLEEVINSKVTLIVCNHCKKYIGHMLCLYKWLQTKPSCPLCRS